MTGRPESAPRQISRDRRPGPPVGPLFLGGVGVSRRRIAALRRSHGVSGPFLRHNREKRPQFGPKPL